MDAFPGGDSFGDASDETGGLCHFTNSPAELAKYLATILNNNETLANDWVKSLVSKRNFLAQWILLPAGMTIDVEINTDDQRFLNWTKMRDGQFDPPNLPQSHRQAQPGSFTLLPTVSVISHDQRLAKWFGPKGRLDKSIAIHLGAVADLAPNAGTLAFDVGNNNSTIAFLSDTAAGDHQQMRLLPADPVFDERADSSDAAVLSIVRITRYQQNPANLNLPHAQWWVGRQAAEVSEQGSGQTFFGAKRMLCDVSRDEPQLVLDRVHSISPMLPAELLVTTMAQRVHQALRMRSYPVVATYPSTYTKAEIDRVRFGIAKALRRALNSSKASDREVWQRSRQLVPRMYDEASAAAFFYLYRDFIRGPGRLHGFDYLYPNGLNLVLYDCGGGTTDIALIHARTVRDGKGDENAPWPVYLTNLGRTGNRYFGGDDITAAFFRLAKWRLASALDAGLPELPKDAGALDARLTELRAKIDQIVPTCRAQNRRSAVGTSIPLAEKYRVQAVRDLWNWCENVKAWVSGGRAGNQPALQQDALLRRVAEGGGQRPVSIRDEWNKIQWDWDLIVGLVDGLIQPEVDKTISATNDLIGELDKRLGQFGVTPGGGADKPGATPSFVHHVYIVGQASHYPYIRKRLEESLHVPYLSPRGGSRPEAHPKLVFDTLNLKGSVVRGAVLMRMAEETMGGARFVYDEQLSERLPFTIGWDANKVSCERLFEEHTRYEDLPEQVVNAPESTTSDSSGQGVQRLNLHRRWPGSGVWEPFLEFTFREPVEGELIVRFDKDRSASRSMYFEVVHRKTGQKAEGRVLARDRSMSPLERGDL